jgi:dolichol-phosphate mannosyltransferase
MSEKDVDISVVFTAYNEQMNLKPLLDRIDTTLKSLGRAHEIVAVDNGSSDGSDGILSECLNAYPHLVVVSLVRNFGYDGGIVAGLEHAKGRWVVVMDGDQQDPPEEIPRFLQKAEEGYEIVFGLRRKRTEGMLLGIMMKLYYRIWRRLANIDVPRDAGNFGVMSREVVDVINRLPERNKFIRGLRAWTGFRSTGLEYHRDARPLGTTKFSAFGYVDHALNGITAFSTTPLRMFTYGGLMGIVAFLFLAAMVVVMRALEVMGAPIVPYSIASGFTTLFLSIFVSASVNLLGLGIIGEYVGRNLEESKHRPDYLVRKVRRSS